MNTKEGGMKTEMMLWTVTPSLLLLPVRHLPADCTTEMSKTKPQIDKILNSRRIERLATGFFSQKSL